MNLSKHVRSRNRLLVLLALAAVIGVVLLMRSVIRPNRDADTDLSGENQQLALTYYKSGELVEARRHALRALAEQGEDYQCLLIASGATEVTSLLTQIDADQPIVILTKASGLLAEHKYSFSVDLLKHFVSEHPDHLHAQAMLGYCLAKMQSQEFAVWNSRLPENAKEHPEVWFARGIAALVNEDRSLAQSCFLTALEFYPLYFYAAEQLKQTLEPVVSDDLFPVTTQYIKRLKTIEVLLDELGTARDREMMIRLSKEFAAIDQHQLAAAWKRAARGYEFESSTTTSYDGDRELSDNDTVSIALVNAELSQRITPIPPSEIAWSRFQFDKNSTNGVCHMSSIRFQDITSRTGIDFEYQSGGLDELPLAHLFETTGGGVGVLDYDCDGWPDLYFGQGGQWRKPNTSDKLNNLIVRNLNGFTAADVTAFAGLESYEFSHGVCVGDFNSDGFDDVYICQLYGNRLFENQGDGTFLDVTASANVAGDEWSLSGAFADLNSDGLSDLFVVNYLNSADVASEQCESGGTPRACPPNMFIGTADRFYLNAGDGTFQDVTRASRLASHTGKGMGVIIADFDRDDSLEVFVGNDGEANFLFQCLVEQNWALPKFDETGLLSGIATDANGDSQATMGIATGDLNSDGLLDLFVTNFYQESNTYYQQESSGGFRDATVELGNVQSESMNSLGFGVQMIDPDLDGDWDLIIANGHVDRSSVTGEPDRMPTQLFENLGDGNFQTIDPLSLGNYFQLKRLGRAVVKLDWNRDGRDDVCVTHLDDPAALLVNQTQSANESFSLRLIGTEGERTAVGTKVELRCGDQRWVQQVTAGDGYLVSNQRVVRFGLGSVREIDELKIHWNSGSEQSFRNLLPGQHFICVENRELLISAD